MSKIECPKCSHEIDVEPIAVLAGEHTVSMKLFPTPGGSLSPKTVGGVMCEFEKLLVACGREGGLKTSVAVKNLATDENGVITLTLLCLRVSKK